MISSYGHPQTTAILGGGAVLTAASLAMQWWIVAGVVLLVTVILLAFFRDPNRSIPMMKGHVVAPCDGRVRSIHEVEHFEPFDGPALCVRIFLSVLDVHVNRSPMHGKVTQIIRKPGKYLNALKAESAELNESVMIVMCDPMHTDRPVCAVKQIAGAIARRIVCGADLHDIIQRGQRYGMIKFGSTTELYLPNPECVELRAAEKQYVYGGHTVLAVVKAKALP